MVTPCWISWKRSPRPCGLAVLAGLVMVAIPLTSPAAAVSTPNDGPACRLPTVDIVPDGPVTPAEPPDLPPPAGLRAAVDPVTGRLTTPPVALRHGSKAHVSEAHGSTAFGSAALGSSISSLSASDLRPRLLPDGTQVLGLQGRLAHPLRGTVVDSPNGEHTVQTGHSIPEDTSRSERETPR